MSENKIKILEPIIADDKKIIKVDTIVVEKQNEKKESLALLEKWRPRMELMKTVYSLEGMAEDIILVALEKANGDLDLAVTFLFI